MYTNSKGRLFTNVSEGADGKTRAQIKLSAAAVTAGEFVPYIENENGFESVLPAALVAGVRYGVAYAEKAYLQNQVAVLVVGGEVPNHPTIASLVAGNHFHISNAGAWARETTSIPRKGVNVAKCLETGGTKRAYLYTDFATQV